MWCGWRPMSYNFCLCNILLFVFGNMLRNILGTHWKVTRTSWEPFENLVRTFWEQKKIKTILNKIKFQLKPGILQLERRAAIPCEKNNMKSTARSYLGLVRIEFKFYENLSNSPNIYIPNINIYTIQHSHLTYNCKPCMYLLSCACQS
jgi:hypothetical protein